MFPFNPVSAYLEVTRRTALMQLAAGAAAMESVRPAFAVGNLVGNHAADMLREFTQASFTLMRPFIPGEFDMGMPEAYATAATDFLCKNGIDVEGRLIRLQCGIKGLEEVCQDHESLRVVNGGLCERVMGVSPLAIAALEVEAISPERLSRRVACDLAHEAMMSMQSDIIVASPEVGVVVAEWQRAA